MFCNIVKIYTNGSGSMFENAISFYTGVLGKLYWKEWCTEPGC